MRPARAALTSLVLLLATPPALAQEEAIPPDVACKEEKATCKEDCSLDYGLSESTRGKVPKCLADCEQAEVICLARFVAKRRAGQAKANRGRYAQPVEETAAPPMDDDLPPVRRRTATRAADLKAAPDRNPEAYEEKVFSRPVPEAAPAPGPAPALKPAPAPAPESPPPKARPRRKKKAAAPALTPAE